jgi:cob(I)alamin adenosyltransferase
MLTLSRVKQATSEFIKVLRFGKKDVQTSLPVLPFGIDSKPVKNLMGIHSTTSDIGETVLIGYIYQSEKTKEGETRVYCTDILGNEMFDILMKNDGTVEFNGNADNLVRFEALKTGLDNMVTALNAELTKIQTAISSLGGTYAKQDVTLDIDSAKINEMKTT